MKKIIALLVIGLAGISAQAQTNSVLSRNAVGYVKIDALSNNTYLCRNDFEGINGVQLVVTNLIGDQVPTGSSILFWDRSIPAYRGATKTRSGWGTFGTNRMPRGDGFFLRIPGGAGISNYPVFLMGEVPDKTTAPTTTLNGISGLAMLGYPYPAQVQWTNTGLAKNGQVGDQILMWVSNAYVGATRTRSGWGTFSNLVIQPGQGFFFRTAITQNWSEVKAYTWP